LSLIDAEFFLVLEPLPEITRSRKNNKAHNAKKQSDQNDQKEKPVARDSIIKEISISSTSVISRKPF